MPDARTTPGTSSSSLPPVQTVELPDGRTLGYRELGEGPAVLLLHGWPTSSFLWRHQMAPMAATNRVLALDLPGFGASDKPTDGRYDFADFESAIDGFLDVLGIDRVAMAGHDLGGPIAVHWALDRLGRLSALALLNTLLYPEFDPSVVEFVMELLTPESRDRRTSDEGLAEIMRLGVHDEAVVTGELLEAVTAPFGTTDDRLALARAGVGLSPDGFVKLAAGLPSLAQPVRVVYGEQDRILPDIAETVAKVRRDLPRAEIISFSRCGHFLQEEEPAQVGELLARFFAANAT